MPTPLKPCPFCGGDATRSVTVLGDHWRECRKCGAQTARCRSSEAADGAWNTRLGEQAVAEECAMIADDYEFGGQIAEEIRARFGG